MEKYPYNSYPESADSSPRSREIEFENPPPWEEQQQQNYKVKFMCSYGGKIQPRSHDNQLAYVGGETKILAVDRNIKFLAMISKLSAICTGGDVDVLFKYQLPGEDLDALISVTNDDDLDHMMHEYDRLLRSSAKPARMRLFLFPVSSSSSRFDSEGSSKSDRDRFVEALNSGTTRSEIEKPATAPPNNADFLFGSEKGVAPPPQPDVKVHDLLPESVTHGAPLMGDPRVMALDHGVNPAEIQRQLQELQRMQIRDQEQQLQQQQEALYRRKSEDNIMETGGYYAPTFIQNHPPASVQQTPPAPAPAGFWQGKHVPGGVFPAATTPEQPVYLIPAPAPGTVYHAPPPAVLRPQMSGQATQGYYPNVQRMPSDAYREQPAYGVVQQPPPQPPAGTQAPPPFSTGPPLSAPHVRQVPGGGAMGLTDAGYAPVYYTAPGGGIMVPPPPYQGVGVAVSGGGELRAGQDGKVVHKVSSGSV